MIDKLKTVYHQDTRTEKYIARGDLIKTWKVKTTGTGLNKM